MAWLTLARHKQRKFQALSRAEQSLFIQALLILPLIAFGLRLAGLRRMQTLLARLAPLDPVPGSAVEGALPQATATARWVKAAAINGPYRATCLPQALAVWWLLRRRGITSDLRLGVRKAGGSFEAHAWVEHAGLVLNDPQDIQQRFAPFNQTISPQEVYVQ
jgi:hypothetical protein